jgi:hypothetical protein
MQAVRVRSQRGVGFLFLLWVCIGFLGVESMVQRSCPWSVCKYDAAWVVHQATAACHSGIVLLAATATLLKQGANLWVNTCGEAMGVSQRRPLALASCC